MNLDEANRRQEALHNEAEEVLKSFHVIEALENLGDVKIAGSYDLKLMVRRDIDIDVYTSEPSLDKIVEIGQKFMLTPNVSSLNITNHILLPGLPGKPKGIYLGVKPFVNEKVWTIDIWFLPKEVQETTIEKSLGFPRSKLEQMSDEDRNTILLLKSNLQEVGKYDGKTIIGRDVYKAVIAHGIRTVEEFEKWIKASP